MKFILGLGCGIFLTIGVEILFHYRTEVRAWASRRWAGYMEARARKRVRMDTAQGVDAPREGKGEN